MLPLYFNHNLDRFLSSCSCCYYAEGLLHHSTEIIPLHLEDSCVALKQEKMKHNQKKRRRTTERFVVKAKKQLEKRGTASQINEHILLFTCCSANRLFEYCSLLLWLLLFLIFLVIFIVVLLIQRKILIQLLNRINNFGVSFSIQNVNILLLQYIQYSLSLSLLLIMDNLS